MHQVDIHFLHRQWVSPSGWRNWHLLLRLFRIYAHNQWLSLMPRCYDASLEKQGGLHTFFFPLPLKLTCCTQAMDEHTLFKWNRKTSEIEICLKQLNIFWYKMQFKRIMFRMCWKQSGVCRWRNRSAASPAKEPH